MKIGKRQRESILEKERKEVGRQKKEMNMSCHKLKESNKQETQALFNIQIN